ncbi:MAG: LLM class flavin-dependent oxidoreductase [Deltaproteobacteria bacterium]|nr:LLM class flavin-dependent oxidoreductase [Deltaproteobacteria bacterium]
MSVRIGIGLGLGGFPFESMSAFHSWLDLCEASRIDSIWQSDRVVSRDPALEPLTLLSVVAGATRRLKFGTNAVVLPFRDPITFARQCATLDHLSDGRFLPAVGIGRGDAPEWQATGRTPKGRGTRADEALEVITRLWESEAVDFEGKYFSLKGATISPRPKQQPLPLWLGGSSPAAIRRTARFGQGWLAPLQSPAEAAISVQAIREEGRRIGRSIPDDHYGATILYRIGRVTKSMEGVRPEYRDLIERVQAIGGPEVVLDRLREFRNGGVCKFIAIPLADNSKDMMEQSRLLDQEVLPHAND